MKYHTEYTSSIWHIFGILTDTLNPGQSGPGSNGIHPTPGLEPHHQIVYCHIKKTNCGVALPSDRNAVGSNEMDGEIWI